MKSTNNHQLKLSKKLLINSISLQLSRCEQAIHKRSKFKSLPAQRNVKFWPKKSKKNFFDRQYNGSQFKHRYCSLPFKLNRVQSLKSGLKKLKSRIQQIKLLKNSMQDIQGREKQEEVASLGPSVFIQDFHEETGKKDKQQKKSRNLLKFKVMLSLNKMKKNKPKEFEDNFSLTPLKISIDLPRIRQRQPQIIKYVNRSILLAPLQSAQKPAIVNKDLKKKMKNEKFTDVSPWATKGQVFNPLEITLK